MKTAETIKLGIIGYGKRGQHMFSLAVKHFGNIEPVAVCDSSAENCQKAVDEFPTIEPFVNYDEMLENTEMDVIIVETPANDHAIFCIKALQKNIHVLSDIPCVYQLHEVAPFWEAAENSQAIYMAGANPNFWGFVDKAVQLKNEGLLGKPYYLEAEYMHDLGSLYDDTPWRRSLTPIQYCTHSLGPLLRLVDEDLKWVSCFGTGSHVRKLDDYHDAMIATFKTQSGLVFKIMVSFSNQFKGGAHSYRILGSKGCFERISARGDISPARTLFNSIDVNENKIQELPIAEMREEYIDNPNATGHGGADYAMLDNFFKEIRAHGTSPVSLKEGLRMSLPGLYAAQSAAQGGELIEIKYPWESHDKTEE